MAAIKFSQNWNGKVGADYIVHITKPSDRAVDKEKVVTFEAPGASASYKLMDYAIEKELRRIPEHIWRTAYGLITLEEFFAEQFRAYRLKPEDRVAVYFFGKVA